MSFIHFNYSLAMEQVAKLRTIASELSDTASGDCSHVKSGIKTNWTGNSSEQYLGKFDKLTSNLTKTSGDIKKVADAMETMANNIKAAEEEAERIARESAAGQAG
jgi:uncharacterized protein YukE